MSTPNRGRGRGYGRGRGRGSNNLLPHTESTVPLIGDWTVYRNNRVRNVQQLPAPPKKEDIPSSSSKTMSFKEAAISETPPDQEYFENPITEKILYLEEEDILMIPNDGWSLKTRYLENRGYAALQNQPRLYLEILLTITESVTIVHHYQNNNPESFINFSKCHINKVLTSREWGLNPNEGKAIKIAEVNPEVLNKHIPNWFYEWWSKFGPSLEILPEKIMNLYNSWCDNSPLVTRIKSKRLIFGQCPFIFFSKFQIPWIWRWTISIDKDKLGIPLLQRNFFYKWWTKMSSEDIQKLESNIKMIITHDEKQIPDGQSSQPTQMEDLKTYFQKKFPNESDQKIMKRVLDHMKNQFFSTFSFPNDDQSMKTASSPRSMDSNNSFNVLAGESQEEEYTPTPEDFWDGLIASLTTSNFKGKGKDQE
ncbi:hypothetical protein ACET3Z_010125 [Daucus carota]